MPELRRISAGCPLWPVGPGSVRKSSSEVKAELALTPPVIGSIKIASLPGLVAVSVAVRHWAARVPAAQFCSGANPIVTHKTAANSD